MAGTDREKALDAALAQIERQFGKGAVMRMGERSKEPIEVIPTGSTALDVALGVGGLPRGRVVEIYGPESSGKTTLTLHAVANAQKAGGQVAFVDAEHALDPEYAKKLGVDIDNLILSQPDNGEQALEIVDMLVRSGALALQQLVDAGGCPPSWAVCCTLSAPLTASPPGVRPAPGA
ncbi:Protein RecA OS=Streptomyces albaduncus OX=68172 GN=recA PE=3 SV=1 [Streptomyces griseoloalbus]